MLHCCTRYTLISESIEVISTEGEADLEMARFAYQNGAFAVMTNDSDFLCFPSISSVILFDSITLYPNGDITCSLYKPSVTASWFSFQPPLLPLFACLVGNDFLNDEIALASLHRLILPGAGTDRNRAGLLERVGRYLSRFGSDLKSAMTEIDSALRSNESMRKLLRQAVKKYDIADVTPKLAQPLCQPMSSEFLLRHREGKIATILFGVVSRREHWQYVFIEDGAQPASVHNVFEPVRRTTFALALALYGVKSHVSGGVCEIARAHSSVVSRTLCIDKEKDLVGICASVSLSSLLELHLSALCTAFGWPNAPVHSLPKSEEASCIVLRYLFAQNHINENELTAVLESVLIPRALTDEHFSQASRSFSPEQSRRVFHIIALFLCGMHHCFLLNETLAYPLGLKPCGTSFSGEQFVDRMYFRFQSSRVRTAGNGYTPFEQGDQVDTSNVMAAKDVIMSGLMSKVAPLPRPPVGEVKKRKPVSNMGSNMFSLLDDQ